MESVKDVCRSWNGSSLLSYSGKPLVINHRQLIELRHLSEGGFSYVSLVKDIRTGELFALKKIQCATRELFEYAQAEISLMSSLSPHPNIIRYFGSSIDSHPKNRQHTVYLLLEYCSGGHLLNRILHRNLEQTNILEYFTSIIRAIHHLHSQTPPIFHRDLKLENILLCNQGIIKLCDFGSASTIVYDTSQMKRVDLLKLEDDISRKTTLTYRSPEMIDLYSKGIINEKADIWMSGCILFTLLFKRHPFQEESILAITNGKFHIDRSYFSSIPKWIEFLFWILSNNPSLRPTTDTLLYYLEHYHDIDHVPLPQEALNRLHSIHNDMLISDQLIDIIATTPLKPNNQSNETIKLASSQVYQQCNFTPQSSLSVDMMTLPKTQHDITNKHNKIIENHNTHQSIHTFNTNFLLSHDPIPSSPHILDFACWPSDSSSASILPSSPHKQNKSQFDQTIIISSNQDECPKSIYSTCSVIDELASHPNVIPLEEPSSSSSSSSFLSFP